MKQHRQSGNGTTPTYAIWKSMRQRLRTNQPTYKNLDHEPRWANYLNFLEDMGERPSGATLERKDGTKGYSKENCIWADRLSQTRNRSCTVWIDFRGETITLKETADRLGIPYNSALSRKRRGTLNLLIDGADHIGPPRGNPRKSG